MVSLPIRVGNSAMGTRARKPRAPESIVEAPARANAVPTQDDEASAHVPALEKCGIEKRVRTRLDARQGFTSLNPALPFLYFRAATASHEGGRVQHALKMNRRHTDQCGAYSSFRFLPPPSGARCDLLPGGSGRGVFSRDYGLGPSFLILRAGSASGSAFRAPSRWFWEGRIAEGPVRPVFSRLELGELLRSRKQGETNHPVLLAGRDAWCALRFLAGWQGGAPCNLQWCCSWAAR